jgi:HK97 family phage portal protein
MRFTWPFTKKSLANPSPELLALFGATPVASGGSVSAAAALAVPAVQSAVRVVSESAASLPVQVVRIEGTTETPATDHPVQRLIDDQANDWTDWFTLIRDLVAQAQTDDRGGLAWVNWVNEKPAEIIQLPAGQIVIEYDQATGEPRYRVGNTPTRSQSIIHVRSAFSRSPLSLAREAIGVAIILERHIAKFFANGARPSGVLETEKSFGDEAVKKVLAGWKAAHQGADNAGKTPLLWAGTTYRPLTMSSVDAQLLELRKFAIIEIARAFRVPPSMLFELDRATWSNGEQQGKEFLTYSLEPWLRALEGALRRALFLPDERAKYAIRFDRDDLTRADTAFTKSGAE